MTTIYLNELILLGAGFYSSGSVYAHQSVTYIRDTMRESCDLVTQSSSACVPNSRSLSDSSYL